MRQPAAAARRASRYASAENTPESRPASLFERARRRRAAPTGTRRRARSTRRAGRRRRTPARRAAARVVEHELELARRSGAAATSLIVSRSSSGGEDALLAADVVEHEREVDARGLRVRPRAAAGRRRRRGGIRPSSSTAAATAAGSIVTRGRTTGLLCILLSPKLGSAIACRLPSPPHTIGTIWSGRADEVHAAVGVDAALVAQDLLRWRPARGRSAATRCRAGTAAGRRRRGTRRRSARPTSG